MANRSAVLCRLGKWQEALDDVELALNCGVPHPNPAKLKDRKKTCLQELAKGDSEKKKTPCPISTDRFEGSRRFPALSDAVSILHSDVQGRFGVAKRDIAAGEVLILEAPTAAVMHRGVKGMCEMCLK